MPDANTIAVTLNGSLGDFTLDVAFAAPLRGITALFGPSGCGKTTVLRCVAGLQHLPGYCRVGTEPWQDSASGLFLPPYRRRVGYVFQEPSLFPHLSVRDNLLFGARRSGGVPPTIGLGLDGIVDLLGLATVLDRSPAKLSGGERQRVAIGRALLSQPQVLLMDEPLSALDRAAKDEILPYIEFLHASVTVPILYVSHDLGEIERLADTLVLMQHGRVLATGNLADLEADPNLPLLGATNAAVMVTGRVMDIDIAYALTRFAVPGGMLFVPGPQGEPGEQRRLRIATADVSFCQTRPADSSILNCLPVRVTAIEQRGDHPHVTVLAALGADGTGARIAGRITRKSRDTLGLAPGVTCFAQIKSVAVVAAREANNVRSER